MRKLMVERLESLRQSEKNFDHRSRRWKNMRINGWCLYELDWDKLGDEELLEAFERIIRQMSKWM